MPSLLKRLTRRSDPGQTWENLSRVCVTLGVFLLPLLVLSWTNDVWETTKAMVLLVTVGAGWLCYFFATLKRREHHWSMTRMDWVVVALWVSLGISTIGSVSVWSSLAGISGSLVETWPVVTAMIGLYFLAGQIFRTAAERRAGWGAMLTGVGLALMAQMFQFSDFSLLPPSLPRANTVFSLISNSLTDVAILAAIFGSTVLLGWNSQAERWQRWSVAAGVLLSWLVLLLAGRPVGWAIWAIGMIAVVLHQAAKGKKADTRLIIVAVLLAATGMAAQLFGLHRQAGLANGPDITLDQSTTRSIVQSTLKSRPVFGTGGATWYHTFVTERPESFNTSAYWSTRFIKAASGWWQALATSGLVGVMLWTGLIIIGTWAIWKQWSKKPEAEWLLYGLVLVAVFVSGFFSTWSLPLLVMAWFFLGLSRSAVTKGEKKTHPIGLGFPLAFVLSALVIVTTWFFAGRLYTAEVVVRQTQDAIARRENLDRVVERLAMALKLNDHQGDASVLLAGAYATQAELALQKNDNVAATGLVKKAVATMRTAVTKDPKNPAMLEAMNNLLNRLNAYVTDAVDEASRNFVTLRKLESTNPIHDVGYGQTLMILRRRLLAGEATDENKATAEKYFNEAIAAYDTALRKKTDYPQAVYAKAQAYTAVEDSAKAIVLLEPLVGTYPDVPAFWIELGLAQSQAKDNEKAVIAYERAVALVPADPGVYLALAQHYKDAGDAENAKSTIERGLATIPNEPTLEQFLRELDAPAT